MKQSEVAKCDDDLVYRVVELLFKERGEDGKWLKMEAIAETGGGGVRREPGTDPRVPLPAGPGGGAAEHRAAHPADQPRLARQAGAEVPGFGGSEGERGADERAGRHRQGGRGRGGESLQGPAAHRQSQGRRAGGPRAGSRPGHPGILPLPERPAQVRASKASGSGWSPSPRAARRRCWRMRPSVS